MLLPSNTTIWWEVQNNDSGANNSGITQGGDDKGDTCEQSYTWIMITTLELLKFSININIRAIAKANSDFSSTASYDSL